MTCGIETQYRRRASGAPSEMPTTTCCAAVGRHEVDFVIEVGREVMAVEVKSSPRTKESDISSLRAFMDRTPHCRLGVLAHGGRTVARMGEKL